ncbi:hypothetical protein [Roseivirga pacifica]|uniref:hypothetical protein n=1 Tax=Roseivirga pacifica TaxID=1267423 RepID=UPI003BAC0AA3
MEIISEVIKWIPAILVLIEVILRLVPTKRNVSLLPLIDKFLSVVPNKASEPKKRHRLKNTIEDVISIAKAFK